MLNSHPRRPLLGALVVFLLAAVAAASVVWRLDEHTRQEARARATNAVDDHADALQRAIEHSLSATYALAALVHQGKGSVPNFDEIAGQMLPSYPGVSELALVPGGIIRNVVPLAGNEKAIGHNLLQDPAQNKEALLALDSGKLTLAGPLNLVQGGRGVIGRLPVFLRDATGTPHFWGFTLVVMRVPDMFDAARLPELAEQGFAYELWRMHPDTGQRQVIAASTPVPMIDPVEKTLPVPNATWTLSAAPIGGWGDPPRRALHVALGLLFSLLLAYLAKLLLELSAHRAGLEALVVQRTAEARAREADLNRAQTIARVGSWVLDLATKELRGSAEAMRIFGVRDGVPFHYRTFRERVHPDDREAVDGASRTALEGKPYGIDFRILDGAETRWVHSQAELAFGANGKLSGALGTVQDITERKQADEALRASEGRYRDLFEANPHPMWVWDLQTLAFLAVNDAAVAHYGYSRDEFLAMIITDIRPPEDVPRLLQWIALVEKQDIREAGVWRHRRKDGALIDVEITSHMLEFGGRRAQIVLANDVTERLHAERKLRDSEERYRALTELSSDWYWEQDENLRFTRISRPRAGMESIDFDKLIGKTRREAKTVVWDESRLAVLEAITEARQPFRDFEISRTYRDGPTRYVQMSGEPIFDASGRFAGYRGIGKDITERKRAEEALRESEERFRCLVEMSSDFYWESDAEHRLTMRGSANAKLSTVSVFQKGAPLGERRWDIPYLSPDESGWQAHRAMLDAHQPFRDFELSRLCADGTERYVSISGDPVFDASGVFKGYRGVGTDITERKRRDEALQRFRAAMDAAASGTQHRTRAEPLARRPVDLSALVREVAGELQAEAPERMVEWVIAPQVAAEGDPGLLRVVLQNLVGNAWQCSSRRDAARIEFGATERNGRPVYFVRDNGAGFDAAYAQKLIDAFKQLGTAAEDQESAIGLAAVSRIIHRHGGEVWAEGRKGEGATFYFSLG